MAVLVRTRLVGLAVAVATAWLCSKPEAASGADPRVVALGRKIAEGALLSPEHTCSRCHGVLGIGREEEGTPRLAGQPWLYLQKQLDDFASGARFSEKMAPVARALTPAQREAVAAYFASLHAIPYPEQPDAEPKLIQRGGVLSAIGDARSDVPACELCHADAGVGIAPSFPYLAGQYAGYTEKQLLLWKGGIRRNDPLDVMAEIARAMSTEDIRAVALYFARVRPLRETVSSAVPEEPIPPPPPSSPD